MYPQEHLNVPAAECMRVYTQNRETVDFIIYIANIMYV